MNINKLRNLCCLPPSVYHKEWSREMKASFNQNLKFMDFMHVSKKGEREIGELITGGAS